MPTFVIRRVFYCKAVQAGQGVALAREILRMVAESDPATVAQRLYTDLSGRTDRIIIESETETFASPRELSGRIHDHPDAARIFSQFGALLDHAETEYYVLEDRR